jgi:hypothetical protein
MSPVEFILPLHRIAILYKVRVLLHPNSITDQEHYRADTKSHNEVN